MDVIPAAITPFDESGRVDAAGVARLIAYFQSEGATGVVVGGTTGEGPSLTSFEKRDLIRHAVSVSGGLPIWLGLATTSLEEALWLSREASKAEAAGVLLMPPFFHRDLDPTPWLRAFLERTAADTLLYNFPRFSPALTAPMLASLADCPCLVGVKDSSGSAENLQPFAQALPDRHLFVGDETLLGPALAAGWSGTISGAANILCRDLAAAVKDEGESRTVKLELLIPELKKIRTTPQPMGHKRTLKERGIIDHPAVRLPLA